MAYNIAVVGTGYVGLVTGTAFADTGNNVFCIDIDKEKIQKLRHGQSPIYEPGLDNYLKKNIQDERIHFHDKLEDVIDVCSIIFLCLPTPPSEDGSADLKHVLLVAHQIADYIKNNNVKDTKIIINKSTVPVGTADKIKDIFTNTIGANNNLHVVSNPEFLREGFAIEDALKPERVVVGTDSAYAKEIMNDLYQPFVRNGNPILFLNIKSAEITKYAANAFLATKISFMNDLSAYCETVGADIDEIRLGIGSDSRIGKRFLFAGLGYGGSCFPKDVKALAFSGDEKNVSFEIVKATQRVNYRQSERFVEFITKRFGDDLTGKKFAVWGLAFKPNTDDVREAPAFSVIEKLLAKGAALSVYDPVAMDNTKNKFGSSIEYASDMYSVLRNTDALVIITEWNNFRRPDFGRIKSLLNNNIIFDGRNLYEISEMKKQNFEYYSIGRSHLGPTGA